MFEAHTLDGSSLELDLFFENMGRSERFRRDNVEMCRRG